MTEHRYREQLPFVHIAGLNWHAEWRNYAGDFLCKRACIQIRCRPNHKIAYMRLNPTASEPHRVLGCQYPWIPVLLVRHRKASIRRQVFECPYCVGWSPILYWVDGRNVRCRHCCPLPHVVTSLPAGTHLLRQQARDGYYGQVAEYLMAGGRRALAGMVALELAGLSPPRLVPERVTARDVRADKRWFWRKRPKVWLRSSRRLIYAEGRLWARTRDELA